MSDRENFDIYTAWQFKIEQEKQRLKRKIADQTFLFSEKRNLFTRRICSVNPFRDEAEKFEKFCYDFPDSLQGNGVVVHIMKAWTREQVQDLQLYIEDQVFEWRDQKEIEI